MRLIIRKNLIIFFAAAALLVPGLSSAEISFQPPSSGGTSGIFNNLPEPVNDLIKWAQDINSSLNSQIGKYINMAPMQGPVNLNQISQMNVTEWLNSLLQNSFLSGIYSVVVKILQLVGNLAIWALGVVTDLIRQGLALIR